MDMKRGDPAPFFDVRLNTNPTYWHCEPGWEWRAPALADHLLWYVMDGRGMLRVDDQVWSLQPGSCFVFRPAAQPHGRRDPERRLVVFGMHFSVVDVTGAPLHDTKACLPPYDAPRLRICHEELVALPQSHETRNRLYHADDS